MKTSATHVHAAYIQESHLRRPSLRVDINWLRHALNVTLIVMRRLRAFLCGRVNDNRDTSFNDGCLSALKAHESWDDFAWRDRKMSSKFLRNKREMARDINARIKKKTHTLHKAKGNADSIDTVTISACSRSSWRSLSFAKFCNTVRILNC